jgi:acyl carrier protein
MNETEIYAGLEVIFKSVFRRTDIKLSPDLTAADVPGWDSFRYVSIIVAAEEYFSMKFDGTDIDEFKNIGDLVYAISMKLGVR